MGTRFRTMLAPIGVPTGDGRRFAAGAITLAPTPFPFEWSRVRQGGHDGAVSIGAVQETAVLSVAEALEGGWIGQEQAAGLDPAMLAVWGRGEMFDAVDREAMPQLAEDVATALHLIGEGTLGPSVDLDTFEGVPVLPGSSTPITQDQFDALLAAGNGAEPKLELLISAGRVRAATLVSIPAFAETSRPLELMLDETAPETDSLALVASVGVPAQPGIVQFDRPLLDGPTPITWDFATGEVYGHIATWRTCHMGYPDVCITAPRDPGSGDFAAFHRFPVETPDGVVWAGRLTVGGRHAALSADLAGTMSEYDSKTVAAHVRAFEDEHGIVVAGVINPDLTEEDRRVLARRKVSGDWRETAVGLSLVEVLALSPGPRAHSEPGFPIETFSRAGRQVALVASLSPDPEVKDFTAPAVTPLDIEALADAIEARRVRAEAVLGARSVLAATVETETNRRRAELAAALGTGS